MKKLLKNEKGFSAVELLLTLILIAVIVFIGLYVVHNRKSSNKTNVAASTTKISNSSSAKGVTEVNPYAGWQSYCSSFGGFCFKFPSGWKINKQINTNTQVAPENEIDTITSPSGKVKVTYKANEYVNCTGSNVTLNIINVTPTQSKSLNVYSLTQVINASPNDTSPNSYEVFYFTGNLDQTASDTASTPFTPGAVIESSYEPVCYFMHNPTQSRGTALRQSFTASPVLTQSEMNSLTFDPYPTFTDAQAWFNSAEVKTAGEILASGYYQ
jgi:Flp pilus assembly pilin Flp